LSIAEKFSKDDAKQIFKSFSEIVTFAQETAETLGARFFANDKAYNADAVRTELLSRAKDLLLTAELSDAQSIATKLERFKGDIVLFASMFKVTQKGQEVKFEDIKGVRLESLSSNELTEMDKATMESILTENWSKQAPELLESTLKSLQDSFFNPGSQFFILRKGDSIAASVRFDEQDDGSLYAGSLNVNDVYRSAGIGEAMLQSTIDTLAKTHIITAHVPAHLPVAMRYVNDFGLKIVGIDEEVLSDGSVARDLKLERDDVKNRHYGADANMERFDLSTNGSSLLDEVQRRTLQHFVGTKYFSDPLNPHLRFIAFEPAVTITHAQERQAA
jgi:GNAT superfamily N-acetyltransferase